MSTKTTFKRIALVAVAALGLGVLSVAPSNAYLSINAGDLSLTATASTATVAAGDTATMTMTLTFTSNAKGESLMVMSGAVGAASGVTQMLRVLRADSQNVNTNALGLASTAVESSTVASGNGVNCGTNATDGTLTRVSCKIRMDVLTTAAATPGVYISTIGLYSVSASGTANAGLASLTFAVTVSAKDTAAAATKSLMYINDRTNATACSSAPGGVPQCHVNAIEADSTISVSAGTVTSGAQTYSASGVIGWDARNAADTSMVTTTEVTGSLIVNLSGPGMLAKATTATTYVKSVTLAQGETAIVYSDGTAGTGTITGYIGSTALTQAAKTVTFTGKATSLVATVGTGAGVQGGNLGYSDSATTSGGGGAIVTFVAKDAGSNFVTSAALNQAGALYAISSDSKVVSGASLAAHAACTAPATAAAIAAGKWTCNMFTMDSGTVTITIGDSISVAKSTYTSAAISVVVAGAAYTATMTSDKTSYAPGEKAIITIKSTDKAGRTPQDGAQVPFGTTSNYTMIQNKAFGSGDATYGIGGSATAVTFVTTNSTYFGGLETIVVYMPNTSGDVVISGYTSWESTTVNTPVSLTMQVVDPNAAAAAAAAAANAAAAAKATAAAKDASDAATDAALEATDAAYAATDAANIAAEAADAATAAAEAATEAANAAKESADAATAAVEELATSVAKLMAALQAQITTLAKVVAKIAVKVKA